MLSSQIRSKQGECLGNLCIAQLTGSEPAVNEYDSLWQTKVPLSDFTGWMM